jgi:hypothetical protein
MKETDSAFPDYYGGSGMTLSQYAAIHLRIPVSGDPGLDAMIRESRRMDMMKEAVGFIALGVARDVSLENLADVCADTARKTADTILMELEKKDRK